MRYVSVESTDRAVVAFLSIASILGAEMIEEISAELESVVEKLDYRELVVDLGMVSFMSSGMIGKLIQLILKSRRADSEVRFRNVHRNVRAILRITGIDRVLRIDREGLSSVRFSPELFEDRNRVLEALAENGFNWLGEFTSVEPLHDVYGIEVRGIGDGQDASRIQVLLEHLYPDWRPG
ncbi:MAG: STAS domain-containing protein [Planctomycetia bacterium]|nr:STAS domain-containing protein [Planctomycetia bacterium]